MNEHWNKKIKIGLLIFFVLIFLIPSLLYISAIDLSKSYTANVDALPMYDRTQVNGTFRISANGFEFKVRVAGLQNTGDNIILLHGFPQTSSIWEPTMKHVSKQGYRILAFDQRGYSPGARPKGVEQYDIDFLVEDLLAVADEIGFDTFHLVGHDWGASVGWKTVMDHPNRIKTWTALSIPHIAVFQDALTNHPEQQKRSSYISKLQTPVLPEFLFVLNRDKMMDNVKGIWRDEDIADANALFAEHGALTSAVNWYRAADLTNQSQEEIRKTIIRPTLFIWGNQDQVIAGDIIPLQKGLIESYYKEIELTAGHSLIQEKQDTITSLLLEHWHQ